MRWWTLIPAAVGVLLVSLTPAASAVPVDAKNMGWVTGLPQAAASDIEFLEREEEDGSLSRYAIVGNIGHGFQIIDITDPVSPQPVGAFLDPGVHYQGDVQVNPRRDLVVVATDGAPAATLGYGGVGNGIAFVDISDLSSPTLLSVLGGLGGSHNSTIIDDRYVYTALPTHIVDYSDPENPVDLGVAAMTDPANPDGPTVPICGHDITLDPNRPDRAYSACSSNSPSWQVIDVSDPARPKLVSQIRDSKLSIPHQADPAPDSSFVVVTDERGGGVSHNRCPGGGAHIYDISGTYTDGEASEANPIKIGIWFAPFTGTSGSGDAGEWGNCTMHNMTFQAERFLLSAGWYSAGAWVTDLQAATADGGEYQEYSGTDSAVPGTTTWGNTQGNIILAGDEVWSTKWTRFDDPVFDRYAFNSGLTRGFDVLSYDGTLPRKVARLAITDIAPDGVLSGKLDRFAVWTYEGWVNKPLAGETVTVTVDGADAGTTETADDGTFSASLPDLEQGSYTVTVAWAGNDEYQPNSVTQTLTR